MKISIYPAKYQSTTNDYLCVICGWQGFPDSSGGFAMSSEIPCLECGMDALVEEEV